MAERAYDDVIKSGRWSYEAFITVVDDNTPLSVETNDLMLQTNVTANPIKALPPVMTVSQLVKVFRLLGQYSLKQKVMAFVTFPGRFLPIWLKDMLRPIVKRLFKV